MAAYRSFEISRTKPVLVIDDDEIALHAIRDLLEADGFTVHTLVSPIGATQVIATQAIAAAVIDLNMPVMRGDRFIALVRGWDRIRDMPIVLLSGEPAETIAAASERLPGVTVVTKAEMHQRLVPAIRSGLNARAEREQQPHELRDPATEPVPAREPATEGAGPALPRRARAALAAWHEFGSELDSNGRALFRALSALHTEVRQLGLANTAELLGSMLQLVEACVAKRSLVAEADAPVSELLFLLASGRGEKNRAFERSRAPSRMRARLERLRQLRK